MAEDVLHDFDQEIASIFTDEAVELLDASQNALAQWNENRTSVDGLDALKRPLHTLKGGARMAGLMPMGYLAHELETLFMQIDSHVVAADDRAFGLAQSALYGALVLFLFSLGMGIPLVIAAVAMARALPFLFKLERAVPWMGLASAVMMAGFGVLLISGNYMVVSEWTYRLASVSRLFFI